MSLASTYIERALKLMVVHQLAGNTHHLDVWYAYYVLNMSPKEIAGRTGLGFRRVRSAIQRMREVARHPYAREALRRYYRAVKLIEPAILSEGGVDVCLICGRRVHHQRSAHIQLLHRGAVERIVKAFTQLK